MMPVEPNCPSSTIVKNCLSLSSHTASWKLNGNEAPKHKAYGIYYAITKWNYYLQCLDIIIHNDHKPLQKFLNGKNADNKVNCCSLELDTYNITFKCISSVHNKAVDCLSRLVEVPEDNVPAASILINAVTA